MCYIINFLVALMITFIIGEKLSKQQLQSNNILKKLRVKEKDSDSLIKTQKYAYYTFFHQQLNVM